MMQKWTQVPLTASFLQLVFENQDLLLESKVLALCVSQLFAQSLQLGAVLGFPARQLLLVQQRLLLQVSTQASHLLSLVHRGRRCGGASLLQLGGGEDEVLTSSVAEPTPGLMRTRWLQSRLFAHLPSDVPAPPPAAGCTARFAPSASSLSESPLTAPLPGIPSDDMVYGWSDK